MWEAIYQENCDCSDGLQTIKLDSEKECSEQTLLYKMVSGLHTSINSHISVGFEDPKTGLQTLNRTYFYHRIGHHEDRIKNFYLIYSAALKAFELMEPAIQKQVFSSQN